MKIDAHAHILPPGFLEQAQRKGINTSPMGGGQPHPKLYASLEERLQDMEASDIDMQILSSGPPGVDMEGASPQDTVEMARMFNDYLAQVVAKRPRQFQGLALLPMQDVEASVKELERAVNQLGLKGAKLFTNIKGKTLDHPDFWPLYQKFTELDAVMYIHPTRPASLAGLADLKLVVPVGVLFESTLAMTRLIYSGVLERFPTLKVVLAHLGSTLPYIIARLDIEGGPDSPRVRLPRPPSDYLKGIYMDTVSHHGPAYYCALATSGAEKILLGSDYPYSLWPRTVTAIQELDIPHQDKEKIFEGNARALFNI